MIPKARLGDQKLYCSLCGVEVREEEISCSSCGSDFRDEFEAYRCPSCISIVKTGMNECPNCGAAIKPLEIEIQVPREEDRLEEDFLRELVESTSLKEASHRVWELAEPFQRVIRMRRKKLEQMNTLLESAQKRIQELETSNDDVEIMEKSELERQVTQLEEERNEIMDIEKGIIEMETIYRNLLSLQETELKRKEDSLKLRLDVFKKEIERRDKDKKRLAELERTLEERETSLVQREEDMSKREGALERREKEIEVSEKEIVEEVEARLAEAGSGGSAEQIAKLEDLPDHGGLREDKDKIELLERRIEELEGEMGRIVKAKEVLEEQDRQLSDQNHDMKAILKRLDGLLGELPDNVVQEFAKSKDFDKYEKVLESCEG
jgi:DNA repair exonuclease SbcCD ATPase subunit